jgi:membrane-bound metal-dependent hydrolase YbcI (DUF457 family)
MSPVGHSIIGLAFAAVALPPARGRKWQIGLAVAFVAIANLPDWPIPNWGHDRYDISHSIYVNLILIVLAVSVWWAIPLFKSSVRFRCMLLGAGAWLSHLLLDSFYNHGQGIAIFWPFSDGRLNLSIPWFNTLDLTQSAISRHNLSVYLIEFVAYLPVLIIAIIIGTTVRRLPLSSQVENAE